MLNHLASTLVLVTGIALLGCAGAQGRTEDPSSESDESSEDFEESDESYDTDSSDSDVSDSSSDSDYEASSSSGGIEQNNETPGECAQSSAALGLSIDRETASLEQGRAQATMTGPVCRIELVITRKDGVTIEKTFAYTGPQRELRWNPVPADDIEMVQIRAYADNGAYRGVKIVPWSVHIEHQEVVFDTDKAIIRRSEAPKLEDSLGKIKDVLKTVKGKGLGTITLFIAGHTDTQGSDEHNLDLSRRRAQAIANWFMKRRLCIPVAYEGFGEHMLKKKTGDEVDCEENRRVDYILAVEPPSTTSGANLAWKWISKGC